MNKKRSLRIRLTEWTLRHLLALAIFALVLSIISLLTSVLVYLLQ